ncbi:hypothetical protein [Azospirillum agricola]|uniref:hypothetical protein n=1 Tax=Azospirillum agricola TaxID=1720247 RepID=UPI000A0F36BB|nr:hypothetical protein [Azospirillum agricola]SMH59334.1 hypothetical protein SAMN02982994_4995 [Azospirillum lipoferum]
MHRWVKETALGVGILAALAIPAAAAAAPACAIPAGGPSVTLPVVTPNGQAVEADPVRNAYRVNISVGGMAAHTVEVDTGSTGIVVPWTAVPPDLWKAAAGNPTHILYTSDNEYLHGRTIQATVALGVPKPPAGVAAAQPYPTTGTIDLMAADCVCKLDSTDSGGGTAQPRPAGGGSACGDLNGTRSDPQVNNSPLLNSCVPVDDGMGMMGVGYARGGRSSSMNSFLRLAAMDGGAMHPGYIITQSNIQLGLTGTNTTGFAFTQLTPSAMPAPSSHVKEWNEPPVTIAFQAGEPKPAPLTGSLLLDTGIADMLLTVPTAQRPGGLVVPGSSLGQKPPVIGDVVPAGTPFTVTVTNADHAPILSYQATMGGAPPSPTYGSWRGATATANAFNLGRHALAAANYAYDAQCGRLGFQQVAAKK